MPIINETVRSDAETEPRLSRSHQVIVVEAHTLTRLAIQRIINDFAFTRVISSYQKGEDVLRLHNLNETDCIVFGVTTSFSDYFPFIEALQRQALKRLPGLVLMQLSFHTEMVPTLLRLGIRGLLDEAAQEKDLIHAIQATTTHGTFMNSHLLELLVERGSGIQLQLSQRELQILSLLSHGETNGRMARRLDLKEKTVEAYLSRIYGKFGVRSRTEAIIYWSDNRKMLQVG